MEKTTDLNISAAIMDENRDLRSLDPSYALSDVRDQTTGPISKETRAVSPQNGQMPSVSRAGQPQKSEVVHSLLAGREAIPEEPAWKVQEEER